MFEYDGFGSSGASGVPVSVAMKRQPSSCARSMRACISSDCVNDEDGATPP
jgi:hypothetical protein